MHRLETHVASDATTTRPSRRERSRLALVQAASRLLEDHAYSEISVERIVSEASLSRPTFYSHFKDKGELLSAVAGDVVERVVDALMGWWILPAGGTREHLHAATEDFVERFLQNKRIWLALSEAAAFEAGISQQMAALRREAAAEFAERIEVGQRQRTVHRDLDAGAVSVWLVALLERGLTQLVATAPTEAGRKRLTASLTDIIWNTLYEGGA